MTESWGQPVLVDNRARQAHTVIGSEILVKSPPDGYTIMVVTSGHAIHPSLITTSLTTPSRTSLRSLLSAVPSLFWYSILLGTGQ